MVRHRIDQSRKETTLSTSTLSARLSDGLQQQLYAEPTVVEEDCSPHGGLCFLDSQCCTGMICEWFKCLYPWEA